MRRLGFFHPPKGMTVFESVGRARIKREVVK
jgi:hypothetical protein